MNGDPQLRLVGLFMIRVSWVMAILGCVLAILIALLSGTDGRDFSLRAPGFFGLDGSSRQAPADADVAAFDPATATTSLGTPGAAAPRRAGSAAALP